MTALFNNLLGVPKPPTGLTENLSPTSRNPCLDFFFRVLPDTPPETVRELLRRAWSHNPLTTLKLICQLRGLRGTGKRDKEGFYTAVYWLHQNHPKTLALNVRWFAEFGCMKDLLEILFRQLAGPDARGIGKYKRKTVLNRHSRYLRLKAMYRRRERNRKRVRIGSKEERILAEKERVEAEMDKARKLRKNHSAQMAMRVVVMYNSDSNYRLLHDRISDFFAESLKSDIGFLNAGEFKKIGVAAKWCPSLDSSFDRTTLLCESIAKRVFPRESDPSYSKIEESHYAYRVRDRLRKEILVPLRKSLELPEVYMSSNCWRELPYEHVASVAMKTYEKLFKKHDRERFYEFDRKVWRRKAILATEALLPHEILSSQYDRYYNYGAVMYADADNDKATEFQWKRMVKDLSNKGKLSNCLSVCDVSKSMDVKPWTGKPWTPKRVSGTPKRVSIALGLLTSELNEDPWRGNVITFSEDPQVHRIQGKTLKEKVKSINDMCSRHNTDFQKVFDRILDVAVAAKLEEEEMVKRVFVFTDKEFDKASAKSWETDYAEIQSKYKEKGYGSSVPEIVYWNLRDSSATPIPRREKGLALVTGFSKNMLNIFLDKGGVVNPEELMEAAIAREEYQRVSVFD